MKRLLGNWLVCFLGGWLLAVTLEQMKAAVFDLDAAPGLRPPETVSWVRLSGSYSQVMRIGPDGMIYVLGTTGETFSELYFLRSSNKPDPILPKDTSDLFLAKYDRTGECLWFKTFGYVDFSDNFEDFWIDSFGNVFISGHNLKGRTFLFDGVPIEFRVEGGNNGNETLRFNLDGEIQKWDSYRRNGTTFFGKTGEKHTVEQHSTDGKFRMELSKFDVDGNLTWTRRFLNHGFRVSHRSVQIGSDGRIYSVESSSGFDMAFEGEDSPIAGTGLLISCFSSGGQRDWYKFLESEESTSWPLLRLDSQNRLTVAGNYYSPLDLGQGTVLESDPDTRGQGFVVRLDSKGNVQWGHGVRSTKVGSFTDLTVDSAGNAFLTGRMGDEGEMFAAGFNSAGDLFFKRHAGVGYHSNIAAFGPNEIYLSGFVARPDERPRPSNFSSVTFGNWDVMSPVFGRRQPYVIRIGEMPLGIASHPLDVELERDGSSATFRVVATGSDKIRYQWRKNGVPLVEDQWHRGVDTPGLTVQGRRQNDEGQYDVMLTTDKGSVTSESAELTFTNLPPVFSDRNGINLYYNRTNGPFEDVVDIEVTDPDGDTVLDWVLDFRDTATDQLKTDLVSLDSSAPGKNQLKVKISGLETVQAVVDGFVRVSDEAGAILSIPIRIELSRGDPTMILDRGGRSRVVANKISLREDESMTSLNFRVSEGNLSSRERNPETLQWRISEEPSFGTLEVDLPEPSSTTPIARYEYTPNLNFDGEDRFVIEVTGDESEGWARFEATVTIRPVGDAPEVVLPLRLGVSNAVVGRVISPQMQDWKDIETDLRRIPFYYQWFINSSAGIDGAIELKGENSASLHVQRMWEGQFLGVRVIARDGGGVSQFLDGHTPVEVEGVLLGISVFSEFVQVSGAELLEGNPPLGTSRLPLALNRRGVFLGGPWIQEETLGRAASSRDPVRNFNDPALSNPEFVQGKNWGLSGQEGVVWIPDAATPAKVDFFNFSDLQEPELKLFSYSRSTTPWARIQNSFSTVKGDYFVSIGVSLDHLNGFEATTRSGPFNNSTLEKISPDCNRSQGRKKGRRGILRKGSADSLD